MIVRPAIRPHPRSGLPIRRTGKATSRTSSGEVSGHIQADAYAGFNRLYEEGRIREAACWAHVRRKFYDLEQAYASPVAQEALERIGAMYRVEEQIRGKPPDQRRAVRQTQSKPWLDSLREWFEAT